MGVPPACMHIAGIAYFVRRVRGGCRSVIFLCYTVFGLTDFQSLP